MKYFIRVKVFQDLVIVEEDGEIIRVDFNDNNLEGLIEKDTELLSNAKNQLLEYFNGIRQQFNLPLLQKGTPFMKKVWEYLQTIPYGKVITYKDLAIAINHPKAYRAVGMACNRNDIPIFIPCHRVVGYNNKLVGYAGGIDIKEKLIKLENKNFKS